MSDLSETPQDRLWREYSIVFQDVDDLTLARWMAQTLGQLAGRAWRLSHPLVGAYRLAAQVGQDRQVWLKRLASPPSNYPLGTCCRAPLLPLFTRDVQESGLICQHCNETCIPFEELPAELQPEIASWVARYAPLHSIAHWDEKRRQQCPDYEEKLEETAHEIEQLLAAAGRQLVPRFLEYFPTVVWEDQDDCLEVRPEDIEL